MARIPETEIERIKQDISLERLAEAAGITLKRHGQDRIGLCPFHDDRKQSLSIATSGVLYEKHVRAGRYSTVALPPSRTSSRNTFILDIRDS